MTKDELIQVMSEKLNTLGVDTVKLLDEIRVEGTKFTNTHVKKFIALALFELRKTPKKLLQFKSFISDLRKKDVLKDDENVEE